VAECLRDLGEAELIRRLARFAPPGQFTDDTATVATRGRDLVVNSDLLVEGIHFSDASTSAEDVGWRAAATNLSDLAASGVETVLGLTVGLVAPPDTPWSWVEGVYTGIRAVLDTHGGVLLGGDCSAGRERMLAITALGSASQLRLHRNQARPGDWLVTSGPHGLSRLGLALLLQELDPAAEGLNATVCAVAIQCHQRPRPRFDALRALMQCKPRGAGWRAGGTDSSDGLLTAVGDLCRSSGCGAELHPAKLPIAADWPEGSRWQSWCLNGGEDFELVLSLPPQWAQAWLKQVEGSSCIGQMVDADPDVHWSDGSGPVTTTPGFQHFKG